MAQKSSVSRRRHGNASTAEHGGIPIAELFMDSNLAQPVFPERKFLFPSTEDQIGMVRGRGSFAKGSVGDQRGMQDGGDERESAHPPTSSRHVQNELQIRSNDHVAKDGDHKTDTSCNRPNANSSLRVKLEPEAENRLQAFLQAEAHSSSFWSTLSSEDLNPSTGHISNIDYRKQASREHNRNPLEGGGDPLEYFRNPSWHDRNLSEQDRESFGREGNSMQLYGYTSEHGTNHSSERGLPTRHEGKSSFYVTNMSKEAGAQSSYPGRRKDQMQWPSEKAAGAIHNEEDEEEDLFHPPVHFASHQRDQKPNTDEQPGSPQWEEEEEMGEENDLPMLEEGELPQFPISTFRARLDETKCHKRKRTPSGNAVTPITPPEQQHECPHCAASFVDANNLKRHIAYIHSDKVRENEKGRKRKRRCEECGKMFDRPSRLERHKVVHSNEKPFVCDVCNKAFSRASNLKIHQQLHSGQKPFVCSLCDKAFSDGGKLKKHQVVHTGDKPFVCDICHKGFAETGNLKRHKKYHIGRKDYACDVCGKAFIESGMLRRHKVQTNHNPIICFVCNRTFLLPENLEEHSKVHAQQGEATENEEAGDKP